jgi:hypothetical protein
MSQLEAGRARIRGGGGYLGRETDGRVWSNQRCTAEEPPPPKSTIIQALIHLDVGLTKTTSGSNQRRSKPGSLKLFRDTCLFLRVPLTLSWLRIKFSQWRQHGALYGTYRCYPSHLSGKELKACSRSAGPYASSYTHGATNNRSTFWFLIFCLLISIRLFLADLIHNIYFFWFEIALVLKFKEIMKHIW